MVLRSFEDYRFQALYAVYKMLLMERGIWNRVCGDGRSYKMHVKLIDCLSVAVQKLNGFYLRTNAIIDGREV